VEIHGKGAASSRSLFYAEKWQVCVESAPQIRYRIRRVSYVDVADVLFNTGITKTTFYPPAVLRGMKNETKSYPVRRRIAFWQKVWKEIRFLLFASHHETYERLHRNL
jgi:hypothetical protein